MPLTCWAGSHAASRDPAARRTIGRIIAARLATESDSLLLRRASSRQGLGGRQLPGLNHPTERPTAAEVGQENGHTKAHQYQQQRWVRVPYPLQLPHRAEGYVAPPGGAGALCHSSLNRSAGDQRPRSVSDEFTSAAGQLVPGDDAFAVLQLPRAAPVTLPSMSGLLGGVNVAVLGLMAAVTWELARAAIVDPLTGVLALAAAVLLLRFRVNSAWLVLGGGLAGLLAHVAGLVA